MTMILLTLVGFSKSFLAENRQSSEILNTSSFVVVYDIFLGGYFVWSFCKSLEIDLESK